MIEATFWTQRLRPYLVRACQKNKLKFHFERIENIAGDGTPDVDYCISGNAGKIELKYEDTNAVRQTTPVLGRTRGMRRSQIIWAAKRLSAGGRVHLCIGTPGTAYFLNLGLWQPVDMKNIELLSAQELQVMSAWCSATNTPKQLIELLTAKPEPYLIASVQFETDGDLQ